MGEGGCEGAGERGVVRVLEQGDREGCEGGEEREDGGVGVDGDVAKVEMKVTEGGCHEGKGVQERGRHVVRRVDGELEATECR